MPTAECLVGPSVENSPVSPFIGKYVSSVSGKTLNSWFQTLAFLHFHIILWKLEGREAQALESCGVSNHK